MIDLADFTGAYAAKTDGTIPQALLFLSFQILGSQSSILLSSGSIIHANLPFSCDSGPWTISARVATEFIAADASHRRHRHRKPIELLITDVAFELLRTPAGPNQALKSRVASE